MESLYRSADAEAALQKYGAKFGEDLALRVYTSRLLGQNPALVLHGGGNTSVKARVTELLGQTTDVLFVKGSGWDLASIEPEGFPACRLGHLKRCCERERMSDEEMVAQLRGQMIDPSSPTPSVEALLHAYLPAKFIDHTHADAVLAVVDQPRSAELVREVFGEQALFVPYVMPGFALARDVAALWRSRRSPPTVMILDKHGIFTWGDTALESYERMIAFVSRAERWLSEQQPMISRQTLKSPVADFGSAVAPVFRGALAKASKRSWITSVRSTPSLVGFSERSDLAEVATRGCMTPDHVLRTKSKPLLVPQVDYTDAAALRSTIEGALVRYEADYHAYFRRCSAERGVTKTELDPWPRVALFPGLGAIAVGRTRAEADIAADLYEHTADVIDVASAIGTYTPASEIDLFDVEYWSLEQAKLGKPSAPAPLDRTIALVTGAASGIGLATAAAFLERGAHVVLADRDGARLEAEAAALAARFPKRVSSVRCDVGVLADVRGAVALACQEFGGLDVVVSNAGSAFTGALHTREGEAALLQSLELNLLAHQTVARAAVEVMIAQGSGGSILFNASKSAFNQGADFGPYAVPKAALIALMRQYAVDLGAMGIRSNAVNADRVRTRLFGAGLLEARAKARGVGVDDYFAANLLHRETTAADVAEAFAYLATAKATTGCVITVDGGNAAAFPR